VSGTVAVRLLRVAPVALSRRSRRHWRSPRPPRSAHPRIVRSCALAATPAAVPRQTRRHWKWNSAFPPPLGSSACAQAAVASARPTRLRTKRKSAPQMPPPTSAEPVANSVAAQSSPAAKFAERPGSAWSPQSNRRMTQLSLRQVRRACADARQGEPGAPAPWQSRSAACCLTCSGADCPPPRTSAISPPCRPPGPPQRQT